MLVRTLIALAACIGLLAPPALADDAYPTRPVRIIVGFAPGGGSDILARLLAHRLTAALGQPVVVDNKPGASGSIGAVEAANAPSDGHTLLVGTSSSHGANKWIYPRLAYDPQRDFVPVSLLATTDYALAVPAASPFRSLDDLVRAAGQRQLDYGSSGNGSTGQLAAEMLASRIGVSFNHVPYRGAAQAINDLIAGQFDLLFDNTNVLAPFGKSGKLRILAVTGAERSKALPDVPTISEAGQAGFTLIGWWALFAPAKTPAPIVERLNRELKQILDSDEVRNTLLTNGNQPMPLSPRQTEQFVAEQMTLFRDIVTTAKIKVE